MNSKTKLFFAIAFGILFLAEAGHSSAARARNAKKLAARATTQQEVNKAYQDLQGLPPNLRNMVNETLTIINDKAVASPTIINPEVQKPANINQGDFETIARTPAFKALPVAEQKAVLTDLNTRVVPGNTPTAPQIQDAVTAAVPARVATVVTPLQTSLGIAPPPPVVSVVPAGWPARFITGNPITPQRLVAGNHLLTLGLPGEFSTQQLEATVNLIAGHAELTAIHAPSANEINAATHLRSLGSNNFTTDDLNSTVNWMFQVGGPSSCNILTPTLEQIASGKDGARINVGGSFNAGPAKRALDQYYPQLVAWLDANASENSHPFPVGNPIAHYDGRSGQVNIGDHCYRMSQLITQVGAHLGNARPGNADDTLTMAEILTANEEISRRLTGMNTAWNLQYTLANPAPVSEAQMRGSAPVNSFGGANYNPPLEVYELERGHRQGIGLFDE